MSLLKSGERYRLPCASSLYLYTQFYYFQNEYDKKDIYFQTFQMMRSFLFSQRKEGKKPWTNLRLSGVVLLTFNPKENIARQLDPVVSEKRIFKMSTKKEII